jgi:hypothetical protein
VTQSPILLQHTGMPGLRGRLVRASVAGSDKAGEQVELGLLATNQGLELRHRLSRVGLMEFEHKDDCAKLLVAAACAQDAVELSPREAPKLACRRACAPYSL